MGLAITGFGAACGAAPSATIAAHDTAVSTIPPADPAGTSPPASVSEPAHLLPKYLPSGMTLQEGRPLDSVPPIGTRASFYSNGTDLLQGSSFAVTWEAQAGDPHRPSTTTARNLLEPAGSSPDGAAVVEGHTVDDTFIQVMSQTVDLTTLVRVANTFEAKNGQVTHIDLPVGFHPVIEALPIRLGPSVPTFGGRRGVSFTYQVGSINTSSTARVDATVIGGSSQTDLDIIRWWLPDAREKSIGGHAGVTGPVPHDILHGIREREPTETVIAWLADAHTLVVLTARNVPADQLEQLAASFNPVDDATWSQAARTKPH